MDLLRLCHLIKNIIYRLVRKLTTTRFLNSRLKKTL